MTIPLHTLLAIAIWAADPTGAPRAAAAAPAAAAKAPAGKLAPEMASEMEEAIIAVNKALGLESWPNHGATPCIDRGGLGITAKAVTPEAARKCAESALANGFPGLGKSYVLAITMASIGPGTVIAVGTGDNAAWGAYSCDPGKKCKPMKIGADNKWGKRLTERQSRACAEPATLWLPADKRVCPPPAK